MGSEEIKIPVDLAGEQVVIAAAVVSEERRPSLVRRLTVDHFQHPKHRAAWECLTELVARDLAYDPATVRSLFGEKVDVEYLGQLADARPEPAADLGHHVDRVLWDSARSNATRGPLPALLDALRDPHSSPEKVRQLGRQLAEALGEFRDRRYLRDPSAVVHELADELAERRKGIAIYPYGLKALDVDERTKSARLIPGCKPGQVTVITGVSGSGKSTIACRIVDGQRRRKRRVLYGAWEPGSVASLELVAIMSLNREEARHAVFDPSYVPHAYSRSAFLSGRFTDEEEKAVLARSSEVGALVRFLDNPFGRMRGEERRGANDRHLDLLHQLIADSAADVFVADLWDRCLRDADPEEEKQALFRMQGIAQETGCHVIMLAQQKLKEIEQRVDKHPTRDCIKGSSAWVDIADTILGAHNPAQWKDIPAEVAEVDVLKQRWGPWPMRVEIKWDPDLGRYGEGETVTYTRATERALTSEGESIEKMLNKAKGGGGGGKRGAA
jgi:replicative DNA helicase